MKIIRSTEKEACKSLVKVEKNESENSPRFIGKAEKVLKYLSENRRRAIVVASSVLLIAGAIFLNWRLFGVSAEEGGEKPVSGAVDTLVPSKNVLEDTEKDSYFALAVIERQRARDEALAVLNNIVDSDDAEESDRHSAVSSISKIADNMQTEANIETLLRAKGFDDCIAVVEDGRASIVIGTNESLMPNEIAQITDIVYSSAGIPPMSLVISEKKN